MFSNYNTAILEAKGLEIRGNKKRAFIIKPRGIAGNALPFQKPFSIFTIQENIDTDCPVITISKSGDTLKAICWEWTPGPGPGEFVIDFNDEDKVVSFITDYYFNEKNEYFTARRNYEIQYRRSINVTDIRAILDRLVQELDNKFSTSEITFGERGTYNKISPENWRITAPQEEETMIKAKWGFLNFEVARLREKVYNKTDFEFEDINNISSLVFELSLLLKDR